MSESERLERIYKRKAKYTFLAAVVLLNANPNSAANRAYYCLYQALMGEFEYRGIRPETIDAGSAKAAKDDIRLKYTHSFVKNNASLVGLDGRQCQIVQMAYYLRRIADYGHDDVDAEQLKSVLKAIPDILECLGVYIGTGN